MSSAGAIPTLYSLYDREMALPNIHSIGSTMQRVRLNMKVA
jgi:hypothetical protein